MVSIVEMPTMWPFPSVPVAFGYHRRCCHPRESVKLQLSNFASTRNRCSSSSLSCDISYPEKVEILNREKKT